MEYDTEFYLLLTKKRLKKLKKYGLNLGPIEPDKWYNVIAKLKEAY